MASRKEDALEFDPGRCGGESPPAPEGHRRRRSCGGRKGPHRQGSKRRCRESCSDAASGRARRARTSAARGGAACCRQACRRHRRSSGSERCHSGPCGTSGGTSGLRLQPPAYTAAPTAPAPAPASTAPAAAAPAAPAEVPATAPAPATPPPPPATPPSTSSSCHCPDASGTTPIRPPASAPVLAHQRQGRTPHRQRLVNVQQTRRHNGLASLDLSLLPCGQPRRRPAHLERVRKLLHVRLPTGNRGPVPRHDPG